MMAGEGPYSPMDRGGMFTVVKIRPGITSYEDPGWYKRQRELSPTGSADRLRASAMP
jgi:hypothetical protein